MFLKLPIEIINTILLYVNKSERIFIAIAECDKSYLKSKKNRLLSISHIISKDLIIWSELNRCPKAYCVIYQIVKNCNVDELSVAHNLEYPISSDSIRESIRSDKKECLSYLLKHYDNVNDLYYLGIYTIHRNNLECVKILHSFNYKFSIYCFRLAAELGYLHILTYLFQIGYKDNSVWACTMAAKGGHLNCLKFLHENKCRWSKNTAKAASNYGHLDCLIYLHEHNCPIDRISCINATVNVDCLNYLLSI